MFSELCDVSINGLALKAYFYTCRILFIGKPPDGNAIGAAAV